MPSATTARTARRTHGFTESVIREMTRVAREHDAINLAQGFPDFAAPAALKDAARQAIADEVNQYAVTWGAPRLRRAIARRYAHFYGMEVDPETEVTVCCGATEAMVSALLAIVDPGSEVVVPEPFYENYGPDAILCQAQPIHLTLDAPGYRIRPERVTAAASSRTRAVILNTPNNPTGRVFHDDEIAPIAELCRSADAYCVTDEIYEHILYTGAHRPVAMLPGMRDRTITVSGASKTFSVTGWRVGWIVAPPDVTDAIRKVHDFLTVGAPAPLQEGVAAGMEALGDDYYAELAEGYRARRDVMVDALGAAGFSCHPPEGAYYLLADFSALSDQDDDAFARRLAREGGVAAVPGSSFFAEPAKGRRLVRFTFCKEIGTLEKAGEALRRFSAAGG